MSAPLNSDFIGAFVTRALVVSTALRYVLVIFLDPILRSKYHILPSCEDGDTLDALFSGLQVQVNRVLNAHPWDVI